jgi:beta-aspartyl-peptidase (threonine type)
MKSFLKYAGIPLALVALTFNVSCAGSKTLLTDTMNHKTGIAIHGGAGNLVKLNLSPEKQAEFRQKLSEALDSGNAVLQRGGTSLDAVVAAVRILEDSPLFNAGKGSVFTNEGKIEMDAAIMDGKDLRAGAVAGVRTVRNPILAARKVMENSQHVLLSGKGADEFAKSQGLEIADSSYFFDQYRWDQLMRIRNPEGKSADSTNTGSIDPVREANEKFGTVGAVAVDKYGNLAAATSTGGVVNKRFGRIGDSPLIGAGTYADNATCAVSCTGRGEEFIRLVAAKDIADMVGYKGYTAAKAGEVFIQEKLKKIGGRGGVIIMDPHGNASAFFNTTGMYRAYFDEKGEKVVRIYTAE